MDLRLEDVPATQLVETIQQEVAFPSPPTVLYSKRNPTEQEMAEMKRLTKAGVIKHAQSPERLLYETTLLLHRVDSDLSGEQREILAQVHRKDETLSGRKVLVVDDDLRNIFALTSLLEHHDIKVLHAENGRAGIELLRKTPDVDIILMDIMMPEMDGYETTQAIRKVPAFQNLPIIALTAKAMKGDRDKCLEAGASDYVTKPVDLEQLFAVMRVWISRRSERIPIRVSSGATV